jgi:uncharacterized protein with PQ loop repeat
MWQDLAFTVAAIIFSVGLIPQIKKNFQLKSAESISWNMCILYMIAITLNGVTCASLGLYLATSLNIVQFIGWIIIGAQKRIYIS